MRWRKFEQWWQKLSVKEINTLCWRVAGLSLILLFVIVVLLWVTFGEESIIIALFTSILPVVADRMTYRLLVGPRKESKIEKD